MQGLKEYMTMLYGNVDTVRAFNRLCYKQVVYNDEDYQVELTRGGLCGTIKETALASSDGELNLTVPGVQIKSYIPNTEAFVEWVRDPQGDHYYDTIKIRIEQLNKENSIDEFIVKLGNDRYMRDDTPASRAHYDHDYPDNNTNGYPDLKYMEFIDILKYPSRSDTDKSLTRSKFKCREIMRVNNPESIQKEQYIIDTRYNNLLVWDYFIDVQGRYLIEHLENSGFSGTDEETGESLYDKYYGKESELTPLEQAKRMGSIWIVNKINNTNQTDMRALSKVYEAETLYDIIAYIRNNNLDKQVLPENEQYRQYIENSLNYNLISDTKNNEILTSKGIYREDHLEDLKKRFSLIACDEKDMQQVTKMFKVGNRYVQYRFGLNFKNEEIRLKLIEACQEQCDFSYKYEGDTININCDYYDLNIDPVSDLNLFSYDCYYKYKGTTYKVNISKTDINYRNKNELHNVNHVRERQALRVNINEIVKNWKNEIDTCLPGESTYYHCEGEINNEVNLDDFDCIGSTKLFNGEPGDDQYGKYEKFYLVQDTVDVTYIGVGDSLDGKIMYICLNHLNRQGQIKTNQNLIDHLMVGINLDKAEIIPAVRLDLMKNCHDIRRDVEIEEDKSRVVDFKEHQWKTPSGEIAEKQPLGELNIEYKPELGYIDN